MTEENNFPLDAAQYKILHLIGCGSTSEVYAAKCLTNNRDVSIKMINLEAYPMEIDLLRQEVAFWSSTQHPTVVKYYNSFISGSYLYILMECMMGGSVADILRYSFQSGFKDESIIATVLLAIVQALDYIHSHKELHRDVKPGNALISSDGEIKIGDFGVAASVLINPSRFTVIGTPCYMAPEILQEQGYTEKADIWSLGITAIELATGSAPYSTMNQMQIVQKILKAPPPHLPPDCGFSQEFINLVKSCLNFSPNRRPTAGELLKNPFFKKAMGPAYIKEKVLDKLPPLEKRFSAIHQEMAENAMNGYGINQKNTDWIFDVTPDSNKQTPQQQPPQQQTPQQQSASVKQNTPISPISQISQNSTNSQISQIKPNEIKFNSSATNNSIKSENTIGSNNNANVNSSANINVKANSIVNSNINSNTNANESTNANANPNPNADEGEIQFKGRFKVKKQPSSGAPGGGPVPQVLSSPLPDVSSPINAAQQHQSQQSQQSHQQQSHQQHGAADDEHLQGIVDSLTTQVNLLVEENKQIKQEIRQLLKAVQTAQTAQNKH